MAAKKEWTRNRGKQPVADGVWVEVRRRDGEALTFKAGELDWRKYMTARDIMAWRRVRAPRKPAAIAPEHAPRPAVPEAKPVPDIDYREIDCAAMKMYMPSESEPEKCHDAPRRPRLMDAVLAIIVAVGLIAAVCYVF